MSAKLTYKGKTIVKSANGKFFIYGFSAPMIKQSLSDAKKFIDSGGRRSAKKNPAKKGANLNNEDLTGKYIALKKQYLNKNEFNKWLVIEDNGNRVFAVSQDPRLKKHSELLQAGTTLITKNMISRVFSKKPASVFTKNPASKRKTKERSPVKKFLDFTQRSKANIKYDTINIPDEFIFIGRANRVDYTSDKFDGKKRDYFHDLKQHGNVLVSPKGDLILITGLKLNITKRGLTG